MNDFEQKILEVGKSVSMTDAERNAIRAQLISLVQNNKVRPVVSPYMQFFSSALYRHTVSVAFIAILFFTGGLSAIADKALPGAFLYSFKTGINEKVLSLFAVSPNSKKQLQITLAERRLEEAETISQDPTVSETVKLDHAKMLDAQISQALEGEEAETTHETEEVAIPVTPTEEISSVSRKAAPTTMMMSATLAPAPEAPKLIQLKKEEPVSAKEIQDIRQSVDTVRTLLMMKGKIPEFETESLSFEAKLLRAQRAIFDAGSASSTPQQKRQYVKDARAILTQIEVFIKKEPQTELKSNTPVIEDSKKGAEQDGSKQIDGDAKIDLKI